MQGRGGRESGGDRGDEGERRGQRRGDDAGQDRSERRGGRRWLHGGSFGGWGVWGRSCPPPQVGDALPRWRPSSNGEVYDGGRPRGSGYEVGRVMPRNGMTTALDGPAEAASRPSRRGRPRRIEGDIVRGARSIGHVLLPGWRASPVTPRKRTWCGEAVDVDMADHDAEGREAPPPPAHVIQPRRHRKEHPRDLTTNYVPTTYARQDLKPTYFTICTSKFRPWLATFRCHLR